MTAVYYKDTMDGTLVRESRGQYEVLWPTGEWVPYEPSYECYLHLEELTGPDAFAYEAAARNLDPEGGI